MTRAAGAIAIFMAPGFLLSFLLALGERDWFHCFSYTGTWNAPSLPSIFAPGELTPVLLETLTPPFSHWLLTILHFGPFALFALLFYLARQSSQRNAILLGLALFIGVCLFALLPAASQHDCDRKGTDAAFLLFTFVPLGFLAALLANKFNCIAGACRHDAQVP